MPEEIAVAAEQEVLDALQRVLESRPFREAHQLQAFLNYVVRETLAGHSSALKEYLIGHAVFGRKQDYDPRRDAIVRVQATMLRKKLEAYYSGEGVADALVIELPRGGYVPVFRPRQPDAPPVVPESEPPPVVEALPRRRERTRLWIAMAFACGCLTTAAGVGAWSVRERGGPQAEFPQLWQPFLDPGVETIVSFGVPLFWGGSNLYFRDVRVNQTAGSGASEIMAAGKQLGVTLAPVEDLYTGVGEAVGNHLIADFLSRRGITVRAANARTIGASMLKGRNLIVVSSMRFQTLLSQLNLPSDFVFANQATTENDIRNLRVMPNERARYISQDTGGGVDTSYAVVSVWPGLEMSRRIVHIGGVHTWATQAATEYVLSPEKTRALAARFGDQAAPFFQVLLRVEGRARHALNVEYVTHHVLKVDRPALLP